MQAEIIALRHQLTVLQRTQKPRRLSSSWRSMSVGMAVTTVVGLAFCPPHVNPETVIGWHRQGFRWYWTWKIRWSARTPPRSERNTRSHSNNEPSESALGCAAHSRRAHEVGDPDLGGFSCQIHGSKSETPVSNVENISRQSRSATRFDRHLHRPYRFPLRLSCSCARPSTRCPL